MRRSFARLGTGSLRGSIFSLSAAAIGSGVLTFPHIVKVNGWFFGLVMILMGGASCFFSHYMLIQSARHHSLMSYNEISEKAGGPRLQKLLQISVMTYIFATCLACTIVCKASILFICCFRLPNLASLFPWHGHFLRLSRLPWLFIPHCIQNLPAHSHSLSHRCAPLTHPEFLASKLLVIGFPNRTEYMSASCGHWTALLYQQLPTSTHARRETCGHYKP